MNAETITSRAVRGLILGKLENATVDGWVGELTGEALPSTQAVETYADLGMVPQLREWIGGRQAKELRERPFTVANRKFESTIEVPRDYLRRDQLGRLTERIGQLGAAALAHWNDLVSALVVAGTSGLCYDGAAYFSASHSEGDSGTQSNLLQVDVSAAPVSVHGTYDAPSQEMAHYAIWQGIKRVLSFKDDQGRPINGQARDFLIYAPIALWDALAAAISSTRFEGQADNTLLKSGLRLRLAADPLLDAASITSKFFLFRLNAPARPIYRQEEQGVRISSKAEGSDFEFDNDAHQYSVDVIRAAFYGAWQSSCSVELVA